MRFKQFIKEGGGAFEGVSSINLANVPKTVKKVTDSMSRSLRIPSKSLRPVGSVGKKAVSGDLDFAIDITQIIKSKKVLTPAAIQDEVFKAAKKLDSDARKLAAFAVTFKMPIVNVDGNQDGAFVQTDIFPTDDLDFSTFVKWSPAENESKYKGVHRNILLGMIARFSSLKVLKSVDEVPVKWERLILDFSRGLVNAVQSKEGKKQGVILSGHKTLSRDLVTKDKGEIISRLLGSSFTDRDANSFESLLKVVNSGKFPYKKEKKNILKATAKAFIDNGILLPSELKRFV